MIKKKEGDQNGWICFFKRHCFIKQCLFNRGAILAAFQMNNEVFLVHAYSNMPKIGNSDIPTIYELIKEPNMDI